MVKSTRSRIGSRNTKQGSAAEQLVLRTLRKYGWTVIPTIGSRSPIDVFAYHNRRKDRWALQVKSSIANMTFDLEQISEISSKLHMKPGIAYVRQGKRRRELYFCISQEGKTCHVFPDGQYHVFGTKPDCGVFKLLLRTVI